MSLFEKWLRHGLQREVFVVPLVENANGSTLGILWTCHPD
ncbi:hypothetical protein ES707_20738 [subsurface metagenome]